MLRSSRRRALALLAGAAVVLGGGTAAVLTAPSAPAAPSTPAVVAAPEPVAGAPADGCPEVEAIAVRATTEPQGGGIVAGPLAAALRDRLGPGVRTHDLVYPATFAYARSKQAGVAALRARLSQTSAACPGTRFVLIGYSQGADVIGDTLASGDVPAGDRVGAVALFGDPGFTSREPFATGSFRPGVDGVLARPAGALDGFADRTISYCDRDDDVCQRGATGRGHFGYGADRPAAVAAVVDLLG
jgi:cutinase